MGDLAMTNKLYVNPEDYNSFGGTAGGQVYIQIKEYVFSIDECRDVVKGSIAFGAVQRSFMRLGRGDSVSIKPFRIADHKDIYLSTLELEVNFLKPSNSTHTFDCKKLEEDIKRRFELQIFCLDQRFLMEAEGFVLTLRVVNYQSVDLESLKEGKAITSNSPRGLITKKTEISFIKAPNTTFKLKGAGRSGNNQIFRPDWNFENMGIGGLDSEFSEIFRRAFASRVFPQSVVSQLGISHVKGMLLYGPPGTGKTLMARQIGKMLNGKEPKIVNGPEILNKYVGQSEENIRNLFKDAETEYKERGDDSDLHILIFAEIDGVDALNNILVIGMTNRKDMIDEALLRPGRLEVHMEIGLPDKHGRLQILRIHTARMRENNFLESDVDLDDLAERTKNYSGAEIEGLVKSAASYAFDRQIDASNPTKPVDPSKVRVTRSDFYNSLSEVPPAFGVSTAEFANAAPNGIIDYGEAFAHVMKTCKLFVQQVENSNRTPLVSVLLEGTVGCGKTALASNLAVTSGFPYVKLISPEQMVGFSETAKCAKIAKIFEDAFKSPLSVIVVDDIERLLDYVPIGPRFSNAVLQTLLVLLKRQPPPGKKLLILGTSSSKDVLEAMEFMDVFNAVVHLPNVESGAEVAQVLAELKVFGSSDLALVAKQFSGTVPVKKLLMIAEMAQQGEEGTLVERFFQCMADYGMSSGASFTIKHK